MTKYNPTSGTVWTDSKKLRHATISASTTFATTFKFGTGNVLKFDGDKLVFTGNADEGAKELFKLLELHHMTKTARLTELLERVHKDLLMRAEIDSENSSVVNLGATLWNDINTELGK
jgi:hypothetical protein